MKRYLGVLLAAMIVACAGPPSSPRPSTTSSPEQGTEEVRGTFDVAGHELFLECEGSGSPTVVMLHGAFGGSSADWIQTQSLLPEIRTCAYDRRNVAHSDTVPGHNTSRDAIADLHGLLRAAGIDPPYVLVGHSFGGMLSITYAGTYPEEIEAVLLVDATMPFEVDLDPPGIEAQVRDELNDNPEHIDFYGTYAAAASAAEHLPSVPVTFMFATQQEYPKEWKPGAYEAALHRFMEGLPHGRVLEFDTTHDMPATVPDEIARQIRSLIATA